MSGFVLDADSYSSKPRVRSCLGFTTLLACQELENSIATVLTSLQLHKLLTIATVLTSLQLHKLLTSATV